jgi:hypothetical protein
MNPLQGLYTYLLNTFNRLKMSYNLKLFHAHSVDGCYYINVLMGISVKCYASKICHSEVNAMNSGTKLIFTNTSLAYVNNDAVPVVCYVYLMSVYLSD